MSQQINLYTPVLLTQQRYFSAYVMVQALVAVAVIGTALCLYEVTHLHRQSDVLTQTGQKQKQMLDVLRATIRQRQAGTVPMELALAQDLQAQRGELLRLDSTLAAFQQGVFRPGEGHAARLALVASSIPATAWVTLVKADAGRFELSGFTFDPSALDGWINQLAASPLLAGQRLAAVNVVKVSEPATSTGPRTGGTPAQSARPVWSFSMTNAMDPSLTQLPIQPMPPQGEGR